MLARRPALAIGDSVLKYELALEGGDIDVPTNPKTLARQRRRIFRDGFGRTWVQRGGAFEGRLSVSPEAYARKRGSEAN
jgi:hypothetical protein